MCQAVVFASTAVNEMLCSHARFAFYSFLRSGRLMLVRQVSLWIVCLVYLRILFVDMSSANSQGIYIYIYIIYTPNLGLEIAILGLEREQGRFKREHRGSKGAQRGSIEGAWGSIEGAGGSRREQEGAGGSTGEHYRAVRGRSRWEPDTGGDIATSPFGPKVVGRLGSSTSSCT